MLNHSLPSKDQSGYAGVHLQQFAEFVTKHRYVTIVIVCLLLITAVATIILIQRSSAHINSNAQAVNVEQKTEPENTPPVESASETPAPVSSATDTQSGNSTSTELNSNNGKTSLKVNNQQIPVPANGSVHRTVPSNNGNTDVNVTSNSSSSHNGTSSSSSSSSIQVNTSSNVSVDNSE